MAQQPVNYKCPKCTGPLVFDSANSGLKCEYCDSKFTIAEIEALYEPEKSNDTSKEVTEAPELTAEETAPTSEESTGEWNTNDSNSGWGEDANQMQSYACSSCGAALVCDNNTAATNCLYCGNPVVVQSQFSNELKPDYVIPFKLSKEDAKQALKKHCKGKFLLPKFFLEDTHIEEIKGVYVPTWLFDGDVDVNALYSATSSNTYTSGDYRITKTRHYRVRRSGNVEFKDIPIDASSKMPDEYMESIEPFDYKEMQKFSMAYMPGYLADKYDVDIEACAPKADTRAINTSLQIMRADVTGYDTVTESNHQTTLNRGKVEYAMAPVWLLTTKWQGKNYLFAMNGQTGKFVGDLPCDTKKYHLFKLALTAGITPILFILYQIFIG